MTDDEISPDFLTLNAKNNPVLDVNQVLCILKECTFNWFELVRDRSLFMEGGGGKK